MVRIIFFEIFRTFIFIVLFLNCSDKLKAPSAEVTGEKFRRCAAVSNDGEDSKKINDNLFITTDEYMEIKSKIVAQKIILGIFSGVFELDVDTKRNIEKLGVIFKQKGVNFIIGNGDLCVKSEDCMELLTLLDRFYIPTLLLPGGAESWKDWYSIFKNSKFNFIIDGTQIRVVRLKNIVLLTLPGYFEPFYLYHKKDGCSYTKQDLERIEGFMKKYLKGDDIAVLVSPSPPRGQNKNYIDWARGGVNIGDPLLTEFINKFNIRFGIFGHVYESGGKATNWLQGEEVSENQLTDSLFVQSGAVEATPYQLMTGKISRGMAILVKFASNMASYETIYLNQ